ncbi:MAG: lysine exporter LysO family protein [Flexistipes sinusarabici]|uniref:Lysine exporter LysO family protein n=1 Tax=Flexistipes sinusarabici TaxID=2352 RepID=A0A5D0MJE7_FLESI|nr:lysine exporter LysO family protein [Flexistipes sinusarabici]TYB33817.1 MAG: lysine exporter LysO family protein [Flexistipes sinusarabici]
MIILMLAAVTAGTLAAQFSILPDFLIIYSDEITRYMLYLLLMLIGYDIGRDKNTIRKLINADRQAFFIPIGTIAGTLAGGAFAVLFINMNIKDSLAISAGFGWYSLSAVIIADAKGGDLGSVAFLTNVFREIISIILIPVLAKYVNPYVSIAPGGATTMDTTLPIIEKYAGSSAAFIAFLHGFILSSLVPVLVPMFL